MAENYLLFSDVLENLTPEEEAWAERQLEMVCRLPDGSELPGGDDLPPGVELDECRCGRRFLLDARPDMLEDPDDLDTCGFCLDFCQKNDHENPGSCSRYLCFYSEENADLDRVAVFVQPFLRKFRPDCCWSLTYAVTCSKPRAGEFGGGCLFITADAVDWRSSYLDQDACRQRHRLVQPIAGWVDCLEAAGIDSERLDEFVHEAKAGEAANLNNGGLRDQLEYLVEAWGVEEAERHVCVLTGEKSPDH